LKFDFKVTTWERVALNEEDAERAIVAFSKGDITSANDLFDGTYPSAEWEPIDICSEQMSVQENGGFATIEVLNHEGMTIYTNQPTDEIKEEL
jgi:hypothetical protein